MICLSLAPVHTVYIMLSAQLTTHEDSIMFPLFFPEKAQVFAPGVFRPRSPTYHRRLRDLHTSSMEKWIDAMDETLW